MKKMREKIIGIAIFMILMFIILMGGIGVAGAANGGNGKISGISTEIALGVIGITALYTTYLFSSGARIKKKVIATGIALVALLGCLLLWDKIGTISGIDLALLFGLGLLWGLVNSAVVLAVETTSTLEKTLEEIKKL